MSIKPEATIYTDGACSGNPGPGGWAAIILSEGQEQTLSGGDALTTNNRQELLGVINGLKALRGPHIVTIISDSKYITDAFNKNWIRSWKANGWTRNDGELKNSDLWQELDKLVQKHSCTFKWVKGHQGNEYNEKCDRLAVMECLKFANRKTESATTKEQQTFEEGKGSTPLDGNTFDLALHCINLLLEQINIKEYGIRRPCGATPWCEYFECTEETGCSQAYMEYVKKNRLFEV